MDNVPLEKPVIHSIATDLDTLSIGNSGAYGSDGSDGSDNIQVFPTNELSNIYRNPYKQYNNGYNLLSYSMGDRLTSKLTSDLPFSTHKYNIRNSFGKSVASGYSSHIIHSSKHGSGESRVNDYRPFSYEYPSEYESALTKRSSYVSEINGGFGSMLTGSYGSVLNNGYKSIQLLSNGGLKGLKFLSTKK